MLSKKKFEEDSRLLVDSMSSKSQGPMQENEDDDPGYEAVDDKEEVKEIIDTNNDSVCAIDKVLFDLDLMKKGQKISGRSKLTYRHPTLLIDEEQCTYKLP